MADPREPSGILAVSANASVFKPQTNSFPISIKASTYLGAAVPTAGVSLKWSLSGGTDTTTGKSVRTVSGTENLVLATGEEIYHLSLAKVPAPASSRHHFEPTHTAISFLCVSSVCCEQSTPDNNHPYV